MCFQPDSIPPIKPVSGAAVAESDVLLTSTDGNRFAGFEAVGPADGGPAVIVLPDVRGLYRFYEQLAVRLAERGYDAMAIDYFGRTAWVGKRDDDFPYMDHVARTTFEGVKVDVAAGVAHFRQDDPDRKVFTLGFCFGGSNSWHQAANGHGLAGAIGFYGHPNREFPPGATPLVQRVHEFECPILGLMGGADPGIPEEEVERFRRALTEVEVPHEIVTYPGAPHSFFDRAYEEYAEESADAWGRVLRFLADNS
jgi:carboxymethylenebutenolidase